MKLKITLLGTSGTGKTTLASLLAADGFYHYSGDYRLASAYLEEEISAWLLNTAREISVFADLLQQEALKIKANIKIDKLHAVSAFVGKLGQQGYPLELFLQRQALFAQAELAAMRDVKKFIKKAEKKDFKNFINDAGGSICEIDDQELLAELGAETLFVYLDTDEDLYQELQNRALLYPKPICYHPEFLQQAIAEYSQIKQENNPDNFISDDFIRFVTPKMMQHRRQRCLNLAEKYGVILNARDVWQIKNSHEFLDLLRQNYRQQRQQEAYF